MSGGLNILLGYKPLQHVNDAQDNGLELLVGACDQSHQGNARKPCVNASEGLRASLTSSALALWDHPQDQDHGWRVIPTYIK